MAAPAWTRAGLAPPRTAARLYASLLLSYEDAQRRMLLERLQGRRGCTALPSDVVVYMPRCDRARTLAAFLDREKCAVHIVWSDEYVPVPVVDQIYRDLRRQRYGRTTDVETVLLDPGRAVFYTTFGEPNPYQVSLHNDAAQQWRGGVLEVYVWTWNHLMSLRPSPFVESMYGYRREHPEILYGTRSDAEKYNA